MSIILRYHKSEIEGEIHNAPYIPIFVRKKSGRLMRFLALVDSGTDTTMIPKKLALLAGIKCTGECKTMGIGGTIDANKGLMPIMIKNEKEKYSLNVPVLVMDDSEIPLLIGRKGFFDNFHITFRENQEKIILKKV